MEWKNWQYVPFPERKNLPSCSGIYVVADLNGFVWYVGQAVDIKNRWMGRGHHRYPQLIRSHRKNEYRIYWLSVPAEQLSTQEQYYINCFKPELNGHKVKSYVPKQPLVEREIKRVIKAINKKIFLFPGLRSLVIGEYLDADQTRCILIAINGNDFSILHNSSRKKYSSAVKQAWSELISFCGRDEQIYHRPQIPVYYLNGLRFEFLQVPELLDYLETNLNACNQYISLANVLGLDVPSLNHLSLLNSISFQEEHQSILYGGKRSLCPAAYLNFRLKELKCLADP
jgi:hypothetical protein